MDSLVSSRADVFVVNRKGCVAEKTLQFDSEARIPAPEAAGGCFKRKIERSIAIAVGPQVDLVADMGLRVHGKRLTETETVGAVARLPEQFVQGAVAVMDNHPGSDIRHQGRCQAECLKEHQPVHPARSAAAAKRLTVVETVAPAQGD